MFLVMLENPQPAPDLTYNYRGVKTKVNRNEAGWNSVYVAGKIIKKIGPILAIKNKEFYNNYVAKNLINNSPNNLKNLKITGLSLNSRDIKRIYFLQ